MTSLKAEILKYSVLVCQSHKLNEKILLFKMLKYKKIGLLSQVFVVFLKQGTHFLQINELRG